MEIKVLQNEKNRLVVEIKDEDATLCNSIRRELSKDEKVKAAAYSQDHPSSDSFKLIVETTGKDPKDAILDAIKNLKKDNDKLRKAFLKEVK